MKKTCCTVLFITAAALLPAQEYTHSFSAGASFGLLHGQAEEIVYAGGRRAAARSAM